MAEKLRDAVIGSPTVNRKEAQFEGEQKRVQPIILQTASADKDALGVLQHLDDVLLQALVVRRQRRRHRCSF
jgi:hypothetical protein